MLSLSASKWLPDWSIGTFSAIAVHVGYLLLVRLLRWRRYNEVHRRFAGRLKDLTVEEAQEIVSLSSNFDIVFVSGLAGAVAFMKTLAIPSTSDLLVKTGEMRSDFYTSKRLADCAYSPFEAVVIWTSSVGTWADCPLGKALFSEKPGAPTQLDPHAYLAIARVNWLHRKYDISNDDYLYTLSVFVLELP
ncbi:hypothetical protein EWM64_g7098 [Hericium alpestre]|uniref:Uncharacterized protein n=1 Tax=Hericium alpestre TaxID=135208 RepID=A0A4Y9ZPT9_9AGAM|nr:hypothetical protein EWM64_g7098 [Hericium alpestre]